MEFSLVIKEESNYNLSTDVEKEHKDLTHSLLLENKNFRSSVVKMESELGEHFLSNCVFGDQTDTLVQNEGNEAEQIYTNKIDEWGIKNDDDYTNNANRETNDESSNPIFGYQTDTLVKNESNEIMIEDEKIDVNEIDDWGIKNSGQADDADREANDGSDSMSRKKNGTCTYNCNQCDYKAVQKRYLKTHLLRHNANNDAIKFKCDSCDYETIYKSYLKTHALQHKNREELEHFKCDYCGHRTITKNSLRMHLQRHKNPEEIARFKCSYCKYQTTRRKDMQQHCLLHKEPDEADMLKCNICNFKTIWKRSLKMHLTRHTKPEVVDSFKCDQCDYKTHQKEYFKRHLRRHLKKHLLRLKNCKDSDCFKCDQCDFKTTEMRSLSKHFLQHKK